MTQQPGESISGHGARLQLFTQHVVSQPVLTANSQKTRTADLFRFPSLMERELEEFPKENPSL